MFKRGSRQTLTLPIATRWVPSLSRFKARERGKKGARERGKSGRTLSLSVIPAKAGIQGHRGDISHVIPGFPLSRE